MFRSLKVYIVFYLCFKMRIAKILKEKSREYKGTAYYKYKVNIPEVVLKSSGLKAGDEIEIVSSKNSIILKKFEKGSV